MQRLALRLAALSCLVFASACQQEPDFDERYARAARELRQKSLELEAELASQAALAPSDAAPSAPASLPAAR